VLLFLFKVLLHKAAISFAVLLHNAAISLLFCCTMLLFSLAVVLDSAALFI